MKRTSVFAAVAAFLYPLHAGITRYMGRTGLMCFDTDPEVKDLPKLIKEVKDKTDEIKKLAEDFNGKIAKSEKISQEAKDAADTMLTDLNKLRGQVTELEQKAARPAGGDPTKPKSLGEQFVESEEFKKLSGSPSQRGRAEIEVKATITIGTVGEVLQTERLPGILELPRRRLVVRDLLTPGQMDGNSLEYVKETGFTNGAANVAEGAKKPESDIAFDLVTTSAKVIAHFVKASRQIMSDAPQLRSYIDGRLLYGLAFREEAQLLNGDGTGQNLLGIIPQATAYAAPGGLVAAQDIDILRLAMLQAELAEFPATGHVLNPIDWARIELLKDTQGRYLIGNPQGTLSPTMWSLPVVATQAIAADKFLTGSFRPSAQIFDRWRARVELATENEDDFVKNLVTILAEERLALAVYRPEGFIYGDLGHVA
jgi:HK97 family phage major capsid protein